MDTQVRTPQAIFMQPQRLLIPLFQRPYVWNEELQWEPLWKDLVRGATRQLQSPNTVQAPHFLGAIVLQQLPSSTSDLQQRTVIDGQQRLTTLQLLLDAIHTEIATAGATTQAARLKFLIANDEAFCRNQEDRFKVWPTNRDRPAFYEVMGASAPVDYQKLEYRASRIVKAHQYFSQQCRAWLHAEGPDKIAARAEAIERSARELLQIVVIDLSAQENAQEIFETLNARGAVLTAADLIKNFVFQRLHEQKANVEEAYNKYWAQFETAFWEEEVNVGRVRIPRSSVFLNHWLVARTGEEVVAREVFSRFKEYADHQSGHPMLDLLKEIHRAATIYREFTEKAQVLDGPLDRVGLFVYRVKALESEIIKPVLLALLDHKSGPLPQKQIDTTLDVLESWLMRRMLIRATAKSYNKIMAEVVSVIRNAPIDQMDETVRRFFSSQRSEVSYWPDDEEVRRELETSPVYRKLSRARLRMVLEAIEDHWRGWIPGQVSAAGMRIRRESYAIEHLMPQAWNKHWPLPPGGSEADRDAHIHRLGNLTLLTKKLNSTVSNGPWLGATGKARHLQEKDVVLLNSKLLKEYASKQWDEAGIDTRTKQMFDTILAIWPVPPDHRVKIEHEQLDTSITVEIADLIAAGLLAPGQVLYSRPGKYGGRSGRILSNGRIDVEGKVFENPSSAAVHIRQKPTNGWDFWRLDPSGGRPLNEVRAEYLRVVSLEGAEEEADVPAESD
ncbi:GmrSD restriction endonuclease domain-containing protein [Tepidimonas sp.]|uniref:GmrSD restriction endonuclease domain-containing protein n=1 Tax=Tepidimonas sp. TaxID=2002775 RepID=UPI002FE12465